MERQCHNFSSKDNTSNESYDYHIDNDNRSIEGGDDESSNTIPGLQERSHPDSSSDGDSVYRQDHEYDHTPVTTHRSFP